MPIQEKKIERIDVMKRYLSKFRFTEDFIQKSILECLSHDTKNITRWYRKDTAYFLAEYCIKGHFTKDANVDMHELANYIHDTIGTNILFYQTIIVPYIAKELLAEIEQRKIELNPIVYQERMDKSSGKIRKIGMTSIKQQVYDYVCVNALKQMFDAKIGHYQCSSIKGRGQEYAREAIEKHIRTKYKQARYVAKADIHKCYPSIKHNILFNFLERDIKNKDVVYLVEALISTYNDDGVGLCIGTYLSQYLANYFLSYAYHYLTEQTFKIRKSKTIENKRVNLTTFTIFYMDDMSIFGSSKKDLKKAMKMLIKYLNEELGLTLKNNTYLMIDLFKDGAFLDAVGYRFYRDRTTIRRRTYRRLSRTAKLVNKFGENTSHSICKSFMSRHGYVKCSNSIQFQRKYKYKQAFKTARKVIRDEAKGVVHRKAA